MNVWIKWKKILKIELHERNVRKSFYPRYEGWKCCSIEVWNGKIRTKGANFNTFFIMFSETCDKNRNKRINWYAS